jgi:hypothetical protein
MSTQSKEPSADDTRKAASAVSNVDTAIALLPSLQLVAASRVGPILAARAQVTGSNPNSSPASSIVDQVRARIANQPEVSPETFVVHGNVIDASGAAATGYKMILSDASGTLEQRLQPQPSNADGYMTLTLRAGEFPEIVGKQADVFVRVVDTAGTEVYAPPQGVAAGAGKLATFTATVPGNAPAPAGLGKILPGPESKATLSAKPPRPTAKARKPKPPQS